MKQKTQLAIALVSFAVLAFVYARGNSSPEASLPEGKPIVSSPPVVQLEASPLAEAETQFERFTQSVLNALPTNEQMDALPEEALHHTPELVRLGGRLIGQVSQQLSEHPEYASAAVKFYDQCALKESAPSSLRALCYSHVRELREKTGKTDEYRENRYAPEIVELASYVPQ